MLRKTTTAALPKGGIERVAQASGDKVSRPSVEQTAQGKALGLQLPGHVCYEFD